MAPLQVRVWYWHTGCQTFFAAAPYVVQTTESLSNVLILAARLCIENPL